MHLSALTGLLFVLCFVVAIPGASAVWWSLLPNFRDYWSRLWNFNLLKSGSADAPGVAPSVWSLANPGHDRGSAFTPMPNLIPPNQQPPQFLPQNSENIKVQPGGPPVHEHPYPPPQFGPIPSRPKPVPQPPKIQGQIQFPFHIPQDMAKGTPRPQLDKPAVTIPPSFQWTPIFQPTQSSPTFTNHPLALEPPELIPIYPDVIPGAKDDKLDPAKPLPLFLVNPAVFEGLVFPASGLPLDVNLMSSLPEHFIPGTKPGSTVWHTFDKKNKVPGLPGTFHASLSLHYEPEFANEAKDPWPIKPEPSVSTRRPSLQSLFKSTSMPLKKRTDPTTKVTATTLSSLKFNPTTAPPFPLTTQQKTEANDIPIETPLTSSLTSTLASEELVRLPGDVVPTPGTAETSGDSDWNFPEGNQTVFSESDQLKESSLDSDIDPRNRGKRSLVSPKNLNDATPSVGSNWSLRQLLHKRHNGMKRHSISDSSVISTKKYVTNSNGHIMAKIQTRGTNTDTTFHFLAPLDMKHKERPTN